MKIAEINKLMPFLMALFPQWKVDSSTTAAWSEVLPDVSFEETKKAVIILMKKNPSPFPPGAFEIDAELSGPIFSPELAAKARFAEIWNSFSGGAKTKLDYPAKEALRLIGGVKAFGQCETSQKDWLERRFVDLFVHAFEKNRHEEIQNGSDRQIDSASLKQISDREEFDA